MAGRAGRVPARSSLWAASAQDGAALGREAVDDVLAAARLRALVAREDRVRAGTAVDRAAAVGERVHDVVAGPAVDHGAALAADADLVVARAAADHVAE